MNYYNEIDPYCAAWLQNLMDAGHITPGVIDTRSIEDVTPNDLRGFVQCHFFAGLGGWAYALDLAGWPRDRSVWTGSCPCQPFSAAGKGVGFADERHLWPSWQHLIAQCRPAVVFGEQVASKAVDEWIDLVHADLEGLGYAFGCVPFPAAGVGAPHIRDRTYWVGHTDDAGSQGHAGHGGTAGREGSQRPAAEAGLFGRVADSDGRHASAERQQRSGEQRQQPQDGGVGGLADTADIGQHGRRSSEASNGRNTTRLELERLCNAGRLADANREGRARLQRQGGSGVDCRSDVERAPLGLGLGCEASDRPGPTNGQWRDADWLGCTDGKWRPVEPGSFPLAHGIPGRVGRLRAYGNAIVPAQAAQIIAAYAEARGLIAGELEAAA